MSRAIAGIGDESATFRVFISNRPNFEFSLQKETTDAQIQPLVANEINALGQACGNGWRKVFNVYAKLVFALPRSTFPLQECHSSWQHYRDKELLRSSSNTALIFNKPFFAEVPFDKSCKEQTESAAIVKAEVSPTVKASIIMGRTYAKSMHLSDSLTWLNNEFAIDKINKLIICPYFDYRQLSNIKICYLVDLINEMN